MTDLDQDARRKQLYGLLGDLPERGRPISARLIGEERRAGYVLEKLVLDLNGLEDVPAYLTRPLGARGRIPFVLYNHAHGGDYVLGKDELLLGREVLYDPPYVEVLSGMGYGVLCIDTWAFGERRGLTEQSIFKRMLWSGQVMWGMMVYDSIRAVDYLVSRDDVDTERIGTLGISMGSTMAWWTAALDVRVKVCIDLCCLTDFHSLVDRGLDHHGVYYFVPSLLKHFTTGQINALIAPRPHLGLAGNFDKLTPPEGLDRIDAEVKAAYAAAGAAEAWRLSRYDIGHFETAAMRTEVVAFLRRWL